MAGGLASANRSDCCTNRVPTTCPVASARPYARCTTVVDSTTRIIQSCRHRLCAETEWEADVMADITIDDLLHWERGLSYQPPARSGQDEGLARTISWAAAIRVTAPIVPSLRGGEIIVAPPGTLARIEQSEGRRASRHRRATAGQQRRVRERCRSGPQPAVHRTPGGSVRDRIVALALPVVCDDVGRRA